MTEISAALFVLSPTSIKYFCIKGALYVSISLDQMSKKSRDFFCIFCFFYIALTQIRNCDDLNKCEIFPRATLPATETSDMSKKFFFSSC